MNKTTTRRQFLQSMSISAAALSLGGCLSEMQCSKATTEKPNILFILTDDQRYDAMGCIGHPFLKTPNMDRIRKEGVLFKNAFVTTSICSPSRATFLTGTYAHTHGVMANDMGIDYDFEKTKSFPHILRDNAGYKTAYIGKWHMKETDEPRPGFDYWLSFENQGVYFNPVLNENGKRFQKQGYTTDILTDYCIDWIEKNADSPFCAYLSHKAAHQPFKPAPRHKDLYSNEEISAPNNFSDTYQGKPNWLKEGIGEQMCYRSRDLRPGAAGPKRAFPADKWQPDPRQWDYFRALQAVDEGIGRLFETLEKLGKLDNTIIVFAGDNGYFWGEHRLLDKRLAYEESIRIPLLMRYPKKIKKNSTIDKMVLNMDMAPTLLDLANTKIPQHMQGKSLTGLFKNPNSNWRKSFLYEYWVDVAYPMLAPRTLGVRTDRFKYITFPDLNDIDELYDLKNDPGEMKNLAIDPKYKKQIAVMQKELKKLLKTQGYKENYYDTSCNKPSGTMLDINCDNIEGNIIKDLSGNSNDGEIINAILGNTESGKALKFDGNSYIDFKTSPTLDPSKCPWVIETLVKPKNDGLILAQGGASRGYLLFIENGIPSFAVKDGYKLCIADARQSCIGKWTHIVAMINDCKAKIYVNGKYVDSLTLARMFMKNPAEGLQFGKDTGSMIFKEFSSKSFIGLMKSVKIYRQDFNDKDVKNLFKNIKI